MPAADTEDRPLLVYDGDCAFCQYWVDYWQALTGPAVRYAPYQSVAGAFPDIAAEDFAAAIYLIDGQGRRYRGAEAAMRVLATVPGKRLGLWCYRRLPGFAALAEAAYRGIAAHRGLAMRLARALWGRRHRPESHVLTRAALLRGLGLVYVAAFWSMAVQIVALVGAEGLSPLPAYKAALLERYGPEVMAQVPMLFWLGGGDAVLALTCWAGTGAGVLLALGVKPRLTAAACWLLYLSIFHAGQVFTGFQWDLLLLEVGFLALLLPGRAGALPIFLFRLLAAKFMFMAGFAKLQSGDPTWRALTALEHHFETQPLPTVAAWYAHQLPELVLKAGAAGTLLVELVVALLLIAPRRPRHFAAWCCIAFELVILATGSYNFFNLLTILICLSAFDDRALLVAVPRRLAGAAQRAAGRAAPLGAGAATPWPARLAGALLLVLTALQSATIISRAPPPPPLDTLLAVAAPLRISNTYGLFANMTTERREIIIEGSRDGRQWRPYVLAYQPGPLARAPVWATPHQPRLDWQMWFAALGPAERNPWFQNLLVRLLQGQRPVLSLLARNPFPEAPPRFVRARLWLYRFTDFEQRRASGRWWRRELLGTYHQAVSLGRGPVRQR